MRFAGFLIGLFGMMFTIFLACDWYVSDMWIFFNGPTMIFYLVVLAGVIVGTSGYKTFIMGVNGALSKKYKMTEENQENAVSLFTLLVKTVNCAAILQVMIGLCLTLVRLNDPASLGPSISVALLSIFYGAFINMALLNPAIYILRQKRQDEPAHAARVRDKEAVDKLLQLCFEKGLTHEDIMSADEITLRKHQ